MIKLRITTILIVSIMLTDFSVACSQVTSGKYSNGLNIAFNPKTKQVTGYYENYSGEDETTGQPRFSCVFYFSGTYAKDSMSIDTYYPGDQENIIKGKIQITNANTISIKLHEDHGGCWNVQPLANESVEFTLTTEFKWIAISHITTDKAYFHSDKNSITKKKAYVIKGDVVYIDKEEQDWIHCTYYGKSVTQGWMKKESINQLTP